MASAVILLPVYMLYLPLEVYGALSICLATSILVQILVTYSFDLSVYIHYHEAKNDPSRFAVFVSSAFIFIGALGVIVLVISAVFGPWISDQFLAGKKIDFFPYGILSVLTGIFQAFFKVYCSLLQSRQQPERFFLSNLLSFSIIVLLTIAGLVLEPGSLAGPVGGRAAAAVISGIWAIFQIVREHGLHFNYAVIRSTFSFNNSSYIYQMQQWIINYFDRLLITFYLTLQDVGAYDFAFKCLLIIDLVLGGLNNSFLPKVLGNVMQQEHKQSTIEMNRYYYGLVAACMILVTCAIIAAPFLLQLGFINHDYKEAVYYVPLMAVIYLVKSIRYYFNFPYGSLKYSKPLPGIYLVISVIKIGLMVLLIPYYGVNAVIFSTLASGLAELVLLKYFVQAQFSFKFNKYKLIVAPLVLGILIVVIEMLKVDRWVSGVIYLVACSLTLLWLYRKELQLIKLFR